MASSNQTTIVHPQRIVPLPEPCPKSKVSVPNAAYPGNHSARPTLPYHPPPPPTPIPIPILILILIHHGRPPQLHLRLSPLPPAPQQNTHPQFPHRRRKSQSPQPNRRTRTSLRQTSTIPWLRRPAGSKHQPGRFDNLVRGLLRPGVVCAEWFDDDNGRELNGWPAVKLRNVYQRLGEEHGRVIR